MEIFERILGIILPVFFSIGIGFVYGRLRGPAVKSDSFVPPMMYNNCGNMGLPLAVLAFGAAGLWLGLR